MENRSADVLVGFFPPLTEAEGQLDGVFLAEWQQPGGGLSQHDGDRAAGAESDTRPAPGRPFPGSATGLLPLSPRGWAGDAAGSSSFPRGKEEENLAERVKNLVFPVPLQL